MLHRIRDALLCNLIEEHPENSRIDADNLFRQIGRDGFAFTVRIGRDKDFIRRLGGIF
jgi:hypothetical protein